MHCTGRRTSLSERRGGLPCLPWPLRWPQLQFVLVSFLRILVPLLVGEPRRRQEQRRLKQPREAEMVASRFVRDVHAN